MRAVQPKRGRALEHHDQKQTGESVDFLEYTITSSSATISRTVDPLNVKAMEDLPGNVSLHTRNGLRTLPRGPPIDVVALDGSSSTPGRRLRTRPSRPDVPVRTLTPRKSGETDELHFERFVLLVSHFIEYKSLCFSSGGFVYVFQSSIFFEE